MGFGNCVLVLDTPENREVVATAGLYYKDTDELRDQLQRVIDDPDLIAAYQPRAMARVAEHYSWETITDQYERLFRQITASEIVEVSLQ
jgi:glycosyltransferase involved in cell wall biosynthesis